MDNQYKLIQANVLRILEPATLGIEHLGYGCQPFHTGSIKFGSSSSGSVQVCRVTMVIGSIDLKYSRLLFSRASIWREFGLPQLK